MRQISNGSAVGLDANAETLHTHSVQYNYLEVFLHKKARLPKQKTLRFFLFLTVENLSAIIKCIQSFDTKLDVGAQTEVMR